MYLSNLELNLQSHKTANWLRNPYTVHVDIWKGFPSNKDEKEDAPFLYRFDLNQKITSIQPRILVLSEIEPNWNKAFSDTSILNSQPQVKEIPSLDKFIREGTTFRFSLIANPTKKIKDYESIFKGQLKGVSGKEERKVMIEELKTTLTQENKNSLDKSLLAKPTKKEEKNGIFLNRIKSKRVGIYDEQGQIDWLKRHGNNHRSPENSGGFELIQTDVKDGNGKAGQWDSAFSYGQEISKFQTTQKKDRETGKLHDIRLLTVTFSGILRVTNADDFKRAFVNGIGPGKAFGCGMLLLARVS